MSDPKTKEPGLIYDRMAKIMEAMPAIGKDEHNQAQNFNYRGIDQVYNALHGLLAKQRVFFTPHVESQERQVLDRFDRKTGLKIGHNVLTCLMVRYTFRCADDGSTLDVGPIPGEAVDAGDKASAKAMSLALKAAILQTFCVPLVSEDDFKNGEPKAEQLDDFLNGKEETKAATRPVETPSGASQKRAAILSRLAAKLKAAKSTIMPSAFLEAVEQQVLGQKAESIDHLQAVENALAGGHFDWATADRIPDAA